jgi:hypothetical protein
MILAGAKDVTATKETRDQPFQFLDLIRNLIYDMSMKDDWKTRERRNLPLNPSRERLKYRGFASKQRVVIGSYGNRDKGLCKIGPTPQQKE